MADFLISVQQCSKSFLSAFRLSFPSSLCLEEDVWRFSSLTPCCSASQDDRIFSALSEVSSTEEGCRYRDICCSFLLNIHLKQNIYLCTVESPSHSSWGVIWSPGFPISLCQKHLSPRRKVLSQIRNTSSVDSWLEKLLWNCCEIECRRCSNECISAVHI